RGRGAEAQITRRWSMVTTVQGNGGFLTRIVVVLFGLALCYFPSYVNPLTRLLGVNIGYEGPSTIILWNWLAVGALLTFVLLVERRSVSSILIKRPNS